MKILFSLTVHDFFPFLKEQIDNILKFNNDCIVLIHVNKEREITSEEQCIFDEILKDERIIFNINRVVSYNYKVHLPQIANVLFAKAIQYDYLVMLTSNEMFFRRGCADYIKKYDAGCDINIATEMHDGMDCAIALKQFLNGHNVYNGQHEGTFYKKHIIEQVVDRILAFKTKEELHSLKGTVEEWVFQTALHNLFKDIKIGYPITILRDRAPGLLEADVEGVISKVEQFIAELRSNGEVNSTYALQTPIKSIFSIKRVSRNYGKDYHDAINKFLKNLNPNI